MDASEKRRRRLYCAEPMADVDDVWTTTKRRHQDERRDKETVTRGREMTATRDITSLDVRMATTIMTMTRDVRSMVSGARRHDGDDDYDARRQHEDVISTTTERQ